MGVFLENGESVVLENGDTLIIGNEKVSFSLKDEQFIRYEKINDEWVERKRWNARDNLTYIKVFLKSKKKAIEEGRYSVKDKTLKVCPTCGKKILSDSIALSRKDNKTIICSKCELKEALDEYSAKPKQSEEKKNV